jgi:hypothetical protein
MQSATIPPYPASWFNRYLDWVDQLPIPLWLYYLLLYIAAATLLHLPIRLAGVRPFGQFTVERVIGGFWPVFESGNVHYLDRVGKAQMAKFRPHLASDEVFEDLNYRIQKMPARPVYLLTLLLAIGVIFVAVFDRGSISPDGSSGIALIASMIILFVEYTTSPVYLYHAFHQLGVVRKAYEMSGAFSLFNLGSLRSLSVISARTGIALFLLFALNYVQNIVLGGSSTLIAGTIVGAMFVSIAILVFVLPLLDIHERIQTRKDDAQTENGKIIEASVADFQSQLAAKNLKETEDLHEGLTGLFRLRDEIEKISPWPWEAGTLRGFLSAILLPVVLFVIQQVISRLL